MLWILMACAGLRFEVLSERPDVPDLKLCLEHDSEADDTGSYYIDTTTILEGTVVAVGEGSSEAGCFSTSETWASVETVLTLSHALQASELILPEGISVRDGERHAYERDSCGTFYYVDLEVTVDGVSTTLLYGQTVDVDGWRLHHGGSITTEMTNWGCADWGTAWVTVATRS